VYVSFVDCLREDTKYAKLVEMLDEALAEYDREHGSASTDAAALPQVTSPTLEQSKMSDSDSINGKVQMYESYMLQLHLL